MVRDTFRHHQGRIAVFLVLIVWLYFLVAFGEQAWRANQLQADVDAQRQAIRNIERENAQLQRELDQMQSTAYSDYVQQIARRDLGLANPGETLVLVRWEGEPAIGVADGAEIAEEPDTRPNWRRWLDAITGSD